MRADPKGLIALLGVLMLGACGGDSATGVSGDASGTYTLRTINGAPLPLTVPTGTNSFQTLKSGSFTINTGNTFSETINLEDNVGSTVTSHTSICPGTYTRNGASFTFVESVSSDPNCGFTYGGTWNGSDTFTIAFQAGVQVVYTK